MFHNVGSIYLRMELRTFFFNKKIKKWITLLTLNYIPRNIEVKSKYILKFYTLN